MGPSREEVLECKVQVARAMGPSPHGLRSPMNGVAGFMLARAAAALMLGNSESADFSTHSGIEPNRTVFNEIEVSHHFEHPIG